MHDINSMFIEFEETIDKIKAGDKESAMIILQRMPDGENKHGMVGDLSAQITLLEWGIHMLAEGCGLSFETIIKGINLKHEETNHIMLNDYKGEIKE